MEITKNEMERLFPSVYITLVSILLGFAVEDVVTRLREIESIDIYTSLAAVGILSGIIAGWIGWSLTSLTQRRLPRVWDAVHVFLMAFCFYALISTLGKELWWFLLTLSIYHVFGALATIYNGSILVQSLSTTYDWGVFRWNILITATNVIIFAVGAWMSMHEILPIGIQISLLSYYTLSNIAWICFIYKGWSRLISELK